MQRQEGKGNESQEIASSITFERRLVVERRFREESKPARRRKSPILRKCEDLMEALWEDGYRHEISWRLLRDYVIAICGGFRTTITDYLGRRAKYYRSRGRAGVLKTPAKQGYLEKFGFIEKRSPKIVILHHERVTRQYHSEQTNIVDFSLSNSHKENAGIGGANAPTNDYSTTTYTKRERNLEVDTNSSKTSQSTHEKLRVLKACQQDGGDFLMSKFKCMHAIKTNIVLVLKPCLLSRTFQSTQITLF